MRKYEVMIIIDQDVDERQVPGLVDKHLETITKGGGTVDSNDLWGRRRLAYDINKKSEGIYAVVRLTADPAIVQEMDRLMGIDENIVRSKVLRLDEKKADESKADESKVDEKKADESKVDEKKADESKADESKADESKADESKADESKD